MKLTEQMYRRRLAQFPEPIQVIAEKNSLVQRVVGMYAHGQILTLEEALCRMVVELSSDWDARTRELFELHGRLTFPAIIPPERKGEA